MSGTQPKSPAQTEFLLSSAIGHAEQPGVLPEGVVEPIQHLLRNVMYYRSELAGSWIETAGELAEEILSIDPSNLYPVVGGAGLATPADPAFDEWVDSEATELTTDAIWGSRDEGDLHRGITSLAHRAATRATASRTPGEPREQDPRDAEIDRLRTELAGFHDFLRPRVDPSTPVEPDDPEGMRRRRDELIDRLIAERTAERQDDEGPTLRAEDLNRVAADLSERHGWLPLHLRHKMAAQILRQQARNEAAGLAAPPLRGDRPQAESTHPTVTAGLLRKAAEGRREYASRMSGSEAGVLGLARKELLSEAATLDAAARVADGDLAPMQGWIPSWRWDLTPTTSPPVPVHPGVALPELVCTDDLLGTLDLWALDRRACIERREAVRAAWPELGVRLDDLAEQARVAGGEQ